MGESAWNELNIAQSSPKLRATQNYKRICSSLPSIGRARRKRSLQALEREKSATIESVGFRR